MHIRELVLGCVHVSPGARPGSCVLAMVWGACPLHYLSPTPVSRAPDESESCQGEPREATPGQQACRLECYPGTALDDCSVLRVKS